MCDIYVFSPSDFASNTDLVAVCCVCGVAGAIDVTETQCILYKPPPRPLDGASKMG